MTDRSILPRTCSIEAATAPVFTVWRPLAEHTGAPLLATNDVHYHRPARRPLQDVLTAIREHVTVAQAGWRLAANAERHLKEGAEMARLFRGHEEAVARSPRGRLPLQLQSRRDRL